MKLDVKRTSEMIANEDNNWTLKYPNIPTGWFSCIKYSRIYKKLENAFSKDNLKQ